MSPQTSPQVAIRPYAMGDASLLYEAVMESRGELAPWMPWMHADYGMADARLFVESRMLAFSSGADFAFVIEDDAGALLGACGLNQIDRVNRRGNLGYWVRSSRLGRGVATAAARQVLDWAFAHTGLHRIEVLASVDNHASQRVAEKAGGTREAVLRQRLLLGDRAHDAILYAFLRSEAAAVTTGVAYKAPADTRHP